MHSLDQFLLLFPTLDDTTTLVFLFVQVVVFVWGLLKLRVIETKAKGNINQAINTLSPFKKDTIYENYDSVREKMLKIPNLGNFWREFDESLLPTADDKRVHNSVNPRDFFTETHLIHNHCDQSALNSYPPALTGLGILGTFVGLVMALHAFLIGVTPYSVDESRLTQVLPSINQIINEPSEASEEQIRLIYPAIKNSIRNNPSQGETDFEEEDLKSFIDSLKNNINGDNNQEIESSELKKELQSFLNESLTASIDTKVSDNEDKDDKGDINTQQLGRAIPKMIQSIQVAFKTSVWGIFLSLVLAGFINHSYSEAKKRHTVLLGVLDELFILHTDEDYLREIREISDKQLTQLKNLADDLVEPMEQAMTKAVSASIEPVLIDLKVAIQKLAEFKQESSEKAVQTMVETIMQKFAGATNEKMLSMGDAMDKASSKMSEAAGRIETLLSNMQATTSSQSQAIKDSIASLAAVGSTLESFKTVGEVMNQQSEIFSQMRGSNLEMMEQIQHVSNQTSEKIESLGVASSTFEDSISQLKSISGQQANVASEFNELISSIEHFTNLLDQKVQSIAEQGDKFDQNIRGMAGVLESMYIFQDNFKESATQISSSLEGFSKASMSVEKTMDTLSEASESLNESLVGHDENISKFLKEGSDIVTDIHTMVSRMDDTNAKGAKMWDTHKAAFQELDKAISSGIDKYTKGVKISLETILGDFDGQMSTAVKILSDSIKELDSSLEEMNDILENFRKKYGGKA